MLRRSLPIAVLSSLVFASIASAQSAPTPRRRAGGPAPSVVRTCSVDICNTAQPHTCVEIGNGDTAWRTCISNQGRRGLVLGPTDLQRTPSSGWMRVLREAGVAEIFVPYHNLGLRLYDLETASAQSTREVTTADAGPNGTVLTLSGQSFPQVVAEVADRGIVWLCKETRSISRRGQELVLWGVLDAANYDFIYEYRLRDDGSIGFRLGATGYNNPFFPPTSTTDAHMHDVLWRIDVDLNGSDGDTALQLTHRELANAQLTTTDVDEVFNGGIEGTALWDPLTFYTIGVEDTSTNVYGNHIGYVLRPNPSGLARHYGELAGFPRKERFTLSDFAVTRFKQAERDALFDTPRVRYLQPDQYLLGEGMPGVGITDSESVQNTDIVLWYHSSTHHDPHDEDHAPGDSADVMTGITNVHWQGVDLEPHNLFDYNPNGGPSRSQCQ